MTIQCTTTRLLGHLVIVQIKKHNKKKRKTKAEKEKRRCQLLTNAGNSKIWGVYD